MIENNEKRYLIVPEKLKTFNKSLVCLNTFKDINDVRILFYRK